MSASDVIGTAGVAVLLAAFAGNAAGRLAPNGAGYLAMNAVGGTLACTASVLIGFVPFVVLEGVWTIVALGGLARLGLRWR